MAPASKVWFIRVHDKIEGPYSIDELRADQRVDPDTLAWRKGFKYWLPIRSIPELEIIFKDSQDKLEEDEKNEGSSCDLNGIKRDDSVLTLSYDPFQLWVWVIIFLLTFIYVLNRLYNF